MVSRNLIILGAQNQNTVIYKRQTSGGGLEFFRIAVFTVVSHIPNKSGSVFKAQGQEGVGRVHLTQRNWVQRFERGTQNGFENRQRRFVGQRGRSHWFFIFRGF
jgi:hypothetical protein